MFEDEGYKLMGAAFEVYNQLGYGMAEEIYQQSLEIELELRQVPFLSKRELDVFYKGRKLETFYKPDLFVFDAVVVELGLRTPETAPVIETAKDLGPMTEKQGS